MNPIKDKNIILGVTGSMAAYKSADLVSKLIQKGAKIRTILTDSAARFVTPLTFHTVTGGQVYTEHDLWENKDHLLHSGLVHDADLMVIAPATASTIAKLANGFADNLLTLTALACGTGNNATPLILAPAMDAGMFSHSATQNNIKVIQERAGPS